VPSWKNRVALHHMIVAVTSANAAWRDGGFTILNIADPVKHQGGVARQHLAAFAVAPYAAALPGRKLASCWRSPTAFNCSKGLSYTWLYDVRVPENPVSISTLPNPTSNPGAVPARFGPHNLHENRPESFQSEDMLFATYHNAGLRIFDIRDAFCAQGNRQLRGAATRENSRPQAGNALAPQSCDINVQSNGVMYMRRLEWRVERPRIYR